MNERERIINILMKRDGLTKKEAIDTLVDCMSQVNDAIENGQWWIAEEIFEDYTGLEPDYLINLLI